MALDKSDLEAIRTLMREEIKSEIDPFRHEVEKRFDDVNQRISAFQLQVDAQFTEVQNNFEGLYARDEKREQENLALNEQIKRHDERIETLEKKVA